MGLRRQSRRSKRFFLCLILDEISTLIKGMAGAMAEQAAARLRDLVKRYMAAFEEAYGESKFRFKHHQLLHPPDWAHFSSASTS